MQLAVLELAVLREAGTLAQQNRIRSLKLAPEGMDL